MSFASKRQAIAAILLITAVGFAGCESESPAGPEQRVQLGEVSVESAPTDINAPWFLIQPNKQVLNGEGSQTVEGLPPGNYQLVWGAVGGWQSPIPNPVSSELNSGGAIEFYATYTEIVIETGSIAVDTTPDSINAPWTISGPNGFMTQGNGDKVLDGREPGVYTLTFEEVPNYQTASTVQGTLESGGRLDFAGEYIFQAPPSVGTILVDITPDSINAPWSITGPDNFSDQGIGDASLADMPVGDYVITFNAVSGWELPVPAIVSRTLSSGELETIFASYSQYEEPNSEDPQVAEAQGNFADGGLVTISGVNFGTHTMDIASGLGPGGWIERNGQGTGFSTMSGASGWEDGETSFNGSRISSQESYSGNNSVKTYVGPRDGVHCDSPQCWQGAYNYDHGSSFDEVFASFRIYFDPINISPDRTQLKIWRVNGTGINGVNSSEEIYNRMRFSNGGAGFVDWGTMLYCNLDCDPSPYAFGEQYCAQNLVADPEWRDKPSASMKHFYAQYHNHVGSENVGYNNTMPVARTWNRIDAYVKASGEDMFDGAYTLNIHRPSETRKLIVNLRGLATHKTEVCRPGTDGRWRYWVFQNYVDDDGGSFSNERADVFIDDIYLQFGTRARVEIGDNIDYLNCRRLEIQEPTDWKDGSISVKMNYGGFAPGQQAFLFVIRDDGGVNRGLPITLQ